MLRSQVNLPVADLYPRVLRCPLDSVANLLITSGTAYWVFVGQLLRPIYVTHVAFRVTTAGAGAQTAEVGIFSTLDPPDKVAKVFNKIISTGTITSLTSTGIKRNTTAFNIAIPAGTNLWAGLRTAMATTQPTIRNMQNDWGSGYYQTTAASGVLTGAGPWTGALPAHADTNVDIQVEFT